MTRVPARRVRRPPSAAAASAAAGPASRVGEPPAVVGPEPRIPRAARTSPSASDAEVGAAVHVAPSVRLPLAAVGQITESLGNAELCVNGKEEPERSAPALNAATGSRYKLPTRQVPGSRYLSLLESIRSSNSSRSILSAYVPCKVYPDIICRIYLTAIPGIS